MAATIIAVVGGIPAGFALNRLIEANAGRKRFADDRARTREALAQLEPIVRGHAGWFDILNAWKNLNEFYEGALIESWIVLRDQITAAQLTDRQLFGDLATHFERCRRLDELIRLRSSLSLGSVPAQQERTQIELQAIETRINNMTSGKSAGPARLADRVAGEVKALSSTVPDS